MADHLEAGEVQAGRQQLDDVGLIVDDEQAGEAGDHGGRGGHGQPGEATRGWG
jgi:hypothetical protein